MSNQSNIKNTTTKIPCAYCRGTGKDRFGVMSALSTCPVCHGKKCHELMPPLVSCAYCRSTGVSPIGARNPCLACGGKGVHQRTPSSTLCSHCQGTGIAKGTGFYCYICQGSGLKRF